MNKSPKIKHSEAEVKRAVIAYLQARKILFVPIQNQGQWIAKKGIYAKFSGTEGAPDLMIYATGNKGTPKYPGMWICIELKSTIGKQSKKQKKFQCVLEERGGRYYIVRSIDDLVKIGL